MVKALERAMAEISNLPEDAQDRIGRELLEHLEQLRRLRADIDQGLEALDRGEARELSIDDVIERARRQSVDG